MPSKIPQHIPENDIIRATLETVNNNADLLLTGYTLVNGVLTLIASDPSNNIVVDLNGEFKRPGDDAALQVDPATEETAGKVAFATTSQAIEGINDTTALTPLKGNLLIEAILKDLNLSADLLQDVLDRQNQSGQPATGDVITTGKVIGNKLAMTTPDAADPADATLQGVLWHPTSRELKRTTIADLLTRAGVLSGNQSGNVIVILDRFCGPDDVVPLPQFTFTGHFEEVATATTPAPVVADFVVYVQENSCNRITGYIIDKNNRNTPQSVDIFDNNRLIAVVTATNLRPDIAAQYGGNATSLYGFEYNVPSQYRDGTSHLRAVYAHNAATAATFGQSPTTPACAPDSPMAPYVVQYRLDGPGQIQEGSGAHRFWLTKRFSDGSESRSTDPAVFSINGGTPAGLTLTPAAGNAEVDLNLTNIDTTGTVTIHAVVNNLSVEAQLQLLDTGCSRPGGLLTNQYTDRYILNSNGNAYLFPTLDEANQRAGQVYNETGLDFTFGPYFSLMLADYNVGTDVYAGTGTDCGKVSNGLYPLFNAAGADTIKKAIQVVDGKIAAVKVSAYTVPVNLHVDRVAYTQRGDNTDQNQTVLFRLSVASELVEIRLQTVFTNGQTGDYGVWFVPNSGVSGYNGYITLTRNDGYQYRIQVRPKNNPTVASTITVLLPNTPGTVPETSLYP